jgi:hypothetical protein
MVPSERDIRQSQVEYLANVVTHIEDNMIDPREFGRLEAEVHSLRVQVAALQEDMRALLALANKSKGGLWTGMTLASMLGGLVSWVVSHWGK